MQCHLYNCKLIHNNHARYESKDQVAPTNTSINEY